MGLIAECEVWDAMLELIEQHRTDKAERKRLGLVDSEKDAKDKTKRKSKDTELSVYGWRLTDGYRDNKRGLVREWGLEKEILR
jgi:hypothetical protein